MAVLGPSSAQSNLSLTRQSQKQTPIHRLLSWCQKQVRKRCPWSLCIRNPGTATSTDTAGLEGPSLFPKWKRSFGRLRSLEPEGRYNYVSSYYCFMFTRGASFIVYATLNFIKLFRGLGRCFLYQCGTQF